MTLIFGYVIYSVLIILTLIAIIFVTGVLIKNNLHELGKLICSVCILFFGWLLFYEITAPHVDIYEKTVKGNITEYTYYNLFQTRAITETLPTDKYVYGTITEVHPSRSNKWHLSVTIQFEDGKIINTTTQHGVNVNQRIKAWKTYWPTTQYEITL